MQLEASPCSRNYKTHGICRKQHRSTTTKLFEGTNTTSTQPYYRQLDNTTQNYGEEQDK